MFYKFKKGQQAIFLESKTFQTDRQTDPLKNLKIYFNILILYIGNCEVFFYAGLIFQSAFFYFLVNGFFQSAAPSEVNRNVRLRNFVVMGKYLLPKANLFLSAYRNSEVSVF
jgi:hypothetical protein